MACGVLGSADVEIDVAPVLVRVAAYESLAVVRVHIAQIVCAAARESRHRAGFERIALIVPVLCSRKRRFPCIGRKILVYFRELKRKGALRKRGCNAVLVADRERLAPIALTGENSVPQTVVYLPVSQTVALHIVNRRRNGLLDGHSVQETGVAHDSLLRVEAALTDVTALDERNNRQIECLGERIVPAVMGRHSHDCAGAVAREHILGNPHRNPLPRKRIHRIGA